MSSSSFAVFILTNNRPHNVVTLKTLRQQGYTGRVILIVDDMDETKEMYIQNFSSEMVYVFSKREAMERTDSADNTKWDKAVVYARNVCHKIASELKLDFFLVLDDDYTTFDFKSNDKDVYISHQKIKNLDRVFYSYVEFMKNTKAKSICFSQGGDFIGGFGNRFGSKLTLYRKAMNSFFCATDRPFQFYGLINEDVTCYILNGSRGDLYFTSTHCSLEQAQTQKNEGGLTTIYLEMGTYVKSFYTLMYHPSSVKITGMGITNKRLHHSVRTDFSYPKIISEKWKK